MEAASSVAGLISLAACVLESIHTLRTFCLDFKQVGADIQETADDLYSLGNALEQLQNLCGQEGLQPTSISYLRKTIIGCKEDVDRWLAATQTAQLGDKKGLQRFAKRVVSTFDTSRRNDLRQKVASHRSQLSLALEMMGRDADHYQQEQLSSLKLAQDDHHVKVMQTVQAGFGKLDLNQNSCLKSIDQRLEWMQNRLSRTGAQRSSKKSRRKGIRPFKKPSSQVVNNDLDGSEPVFNGSERGDGGQPHTLMRLVKTAYLVQEANGKPVIEMLATADRGFESADENTKISMIKYIQGLRLLIWLLRRDNLTFTARFCAQDDSKSSLVMGGTLNTGYKRLIISSEFLRWKQFSLVQKKFSPLHGGAVPKASEQIVRSYFLCNEYGQDLFRFYLSLPEGFGAEELAKRFGEDSKDPEWTRARRQRITLFTHYLGNSEDSGETSLSPSEQIIPYSTAMKLRSQPLGNDSNIDEGLMRPRKRIKLSDFNDDLLHFRLEDPISMDDNGQKTPISRCSTVDSAIDLSNDLEGEHSVMPDHMDVDESVNHLKQATPCFAAEIDAAQPVRSALELPEQSVSGDQGEPPLRHVTNMKTVSEANLPQKPSSTYRAPPKSNSLNVYISQDHSENFLPDVQEVAGKTNTAELEHEPWSEGDLTHRRRVQNRLAQQQYAWKLKSQLGNSQTPRDMREVADTAVAARPASSQSTVEDVPMQRGLVSRVVESCTSESSSGSVIDSKVQHQMAAHLWHNMQTLYSDGAPDPQGGALADYQMQLMLLEQQNKRRLLMARQEQDTAPQVPVNALNVNYLTQPQKAPCHTGSNLGTIQTQGQSTRMTGAGHDLDPSYQASYPLDEERPSGSHGLTSLHDWHQQVGIDQRAHYGTQIFTDLQQVRNKLCNFRSSCSDADLWTIAMGVEANSYMQCQDVTEYHQRITSNQLILSQLRQILGSRISSQSSTDTEASNVEELMHSGLFSPTSTAFEAASRFLAFLWRFIEAFRNQQRHHEALRWLQNDDTSYYSGMQQMAPQMQGARKLFSTLNPNGPVAVNGSG